MGRNKFEKQLKEQLQRREIQPSQAAWDTISEQLEDFETSKSNRFQWYGIAAGFIGVLFVSVLFFTVKESSTVPETEIINVKNDSIPLNSKTENIHEEKLKNDNVIVETRVRQEESIQNTSKSNQDKSLKDVLAGSTYEERKIDKVVLSLNTSEELIDAKIAEIIDQVAVLEKENSTVTDAEIDSLLRGAQRQILEDKFIRDDKSVDAMALLADVEDELDQSFRDQIFDALKDGFLKVRTAVADRNR